ncbi:MAG: hypothetical protein EAZ83_22395 [Oscillatoriales cyanobacterium]|uniref:hypothetical protein n=1 Tax=unclassified Microcoleus TaxID=2642155 RepID=UPI001DDB0397|nr:MULTISPECIES: hypothetical protein [unclassified Microcoleus]TAE79177.1 MAG: hypothetical protein EAZ83_22395 [Oscillatoriales cyanobacterium]
MMNYFKPLLIFTAFAAVVGLGKTVAIAAVWNISETELSLPLHRVQIAAKSDRNFKTSKGTLKPGSVLSVDPDEVRGIPKAEARRRFILNKIYRVQEGTTADDLFIVDDKANKWVVKDVLSATEDATNKSAALIVSCNANVWAVIENF